MKLEHYLPPLQLLISEMASRSSISGYDVFICFEAADTGQSFASHLEAALHRKRIKAFSDDDEDDHETGTSLSCSSLSLETVEPTVSVVIFSENFGASTRCLTQLVKIIEQRNSTGHLVVPVFYDVYPFTVRNQTGSFREAFAEHETRFDQTKVLMWRRALVEAANLPGWISFAIRPESALVDRIAQDIEKKVKYPKYSVAVAFVMANFIAEILSAAADRLASSQKPFFAIFSLVISFISLAFCIAELAYKGRGQRLRLRCTWPVPWFYHPPPGSKRFGGLIDIVGLICTTCQCIVAIINYCFLQRRVDSPINISVWPPIFAFGLLCSKFMEKPRKSLEIDNRINIHQITEYQTICQQANRTKTSVFPSLSPNTSKARSPNVKTSSPLETSLQWSLPITGTTSGTFASHLHAALLKKNIRVFTDDGMIIGRREA